MRYGTRRADRARYGKRRGAAPPAELAEPPADLAGLPAWWSARLEWAGSNGGWPAAWRIDDDLTTLAAAEFAPTSTPAAELDRVHAEMDALRATRPHPCNVNGNIEMRLTGDTISEFGE